MKLYCQKCKEIKEVGSNVIKSNVNDVALCHKCGTPLKSFLREEVPPVEVSGNVQSNMKILFG